MKFILKKSELSENIYNSIRKIGYRFREKDEKKSEFIFIRPLERNGYPIFHLYLKIKKQSLVFNLHLDQKKPVYKGTAAHAAEYKGEIVENEAERIKEKIIL